MLPAPFAYGETAAPAFLYSYVPFLLLGFVFQFIARHLLYTPERVIVEGSFATSHHYCPMSVQPSSALTVTEIQSAPEYRPGSSTDLGSRLKRLPKMIMRCQTFNAPFRGRSNHQFTGGYDYLNSAGPCRGYLFCFFLCLPDRGQFAMS